MLNSLEKKLQWEHFHCLKTTSKNVNISQMNEKKCDKIINSPHINDNLLMEWIELILTIYFMN